MKDTSLRSPAENGFREHRRRPANSLHLSSAPKEQEIIMIKDKTVIITGASSGIGEATAKLLARKGAKVVLGARREDRLKQIADEIAGDGGRAVYRELDVTRQTDNDAIVKFAKDTFGRVDVIFLNAGLMPNSPLSALKTDDWHQMVDVNVKGVLNGVAAVLPEFVARKSGHVIATSSVAGLKAYPNGAVYGGTKWFVRDFMEVHGSGGIVPPRAA
jgi:NADP-dependent 3-hydroxy acid dehydrogenase YdfG